MEFNRPTLFIDPSFTMTACCLVDPNKKSFEFQGFSRAETKRDLHHYYVAARDIQRSFASYLERLFSRYSDGFDVVMEAPFPGSFASSGLYMLQAYLLEALSSYSANLNFYSLSPSFISGQIKKVNEKKDGIGIRKRWCSATLEKLAADGWTIIHPEMLKVAKADCQTAFGFWYFLSMSDKKLERFEL